MGERGTSFCDLGRKAFLVSVTCIRGNRRAEALGLFWRHSVPFSLKHSACQAPSLSEPQQWLSTAVALEFDDFLMGRMPTQRVDQEEHVFSTLKEVARARGSLRTYTGVRCLFLQVTRLGRGESGESGDQILAVFTTLKT